MITAASSVSSRMESRFQPRLWGRIDQELTQITPFMNSKDPETAFVCRRIHDIIGNSQRTRFTCIRKPRWGKIEAYDFSIISTNLFTSVTKKEYIRFWWGGWWYDNTFHKSRDKNSQIRWITFWIRFHGRIGVHCARCCEHNYPFDCPLVTGNPCHSLMDLDVPVHFSRKLRAIRFLR